jgi:hypothetical protein
MDVIFSRTTLDTLLVCDYDKLDIRPIILCSIFQTVFILDLSRRRKRREEKKKKEGRRGRGEKIHTYMHVHIMKIIQGTRARNNDRRQSSTDLGIWPCAPTLIIYRLQYHLSLLRAVWRYAYLEALLFLGLLRLRLSISVLGTTQLDQGYFLCLTCTDRSRMTLPITPVAWI